MNEKNDQPTPGQPEEPSADVESRQQEELNEDQKAAPQEQRREGAEAAAERQMQEALEAGDAEQALGSAPKGTAAPVHQVDVDPVKTVPKAPPDTESNLKLILDIPVEVKVEVGHSRLSIREVLNLGPGAIVELDRTAGSPADLIVNGAKVGQGDVVVVDESYGIRITKLVDPQDRINSL